MAAGKSTIGKRLARELGVPFVDTDAEIVALHGSIDALFAREGEAAFREYERCAIEAALSGEPKVVSLGGGAVTHPATRALLAERAVRVFVEVPPTTVAARVRRSTTVRPVLGTKPTLARIRELFAQREAYYREAEITVDGRGSVGKIARTIVERLRGIEAL